MFQRQLWPSRRGPGGSFQMGKQTTKTNHPTLISSNNPFHTTSIENHLVFF